MFSSPPAASSRDDTFGRRILVVDDDENLLGNLGAFLEGHGYVPVCVPDVHAALEWLRTDSVDGVVADYRLGRESGLDLIRAIRDLDPGTPVILMSAYIDEWIEVLARSLQVRCIKKPFSGAEMLEAIQQGLGAP